MYFLSCSQGSSPVREALDVPTSTKSYVVHNEFLEIQLSFPKIRGCHDQKYTFQYLPTSKDLLNGGFAAAFHS